VEQKMSVPIPAFFWFVPFHYQSVKVLEKVSLEYHSSSLTKKPEQRFEQNLRKLFSRYQKTGKLNGTRFDLTGMASVSNLAHAWKKGLRMN